MSNFWEDLYAAWVYWRWLRTEVQARREMAREFERNNSHMREVPQ